ncbi:MAG: DnaA/Hda family protein [Pseudomonadota bacterium]
MSGSGQIPMDLSLPPASGGADFLVSPSNQTARQAIAAWRDWPDHRLALTGPEGCGKSHLVRIWRDETGARIIDAKDLTEAKLPLLADGAGAAVEDIDRLAEIPGPARRQVETVLFHLVNMMMSDGIPLLITGRSAPAHWRVDLPDLASRLSAMVHVRIAEPDDALLSSILDKLFRDRQMVVGPDVIEYLLKRIERSFSAAERVVAELDRVALAERRGITRPLAAAVLDGATTDPGET